MEAVGTGRRERGARRRGSSIVGAAVAAVVAMVVAALGGCAGVGPGGQVVASTGVATRRVTVTPVDQHWNVTRGWSVEEGESGPGAQIDCGDTRQAYPSPASVSGDVYYCSPSAAAADVCWPTPQPRRMLCLRDPFSTVLTALTAQALVAKVDPPRNPVPLGLLLADGERCRLRDGGAWGAPRGHPDLVGYYSCGADDIVWALPDSSTGGIDKATSSWTVLVGDVTGPLSTRAVTQATFVATAA
ncbi:conserved hypothetical protein [Frankia canadensis]|uniref:Uncharacterized protein n=1 Tax=Frankia canadensis TaxID=1836972 RepID=A0A2I2L1H0_9ACTN|nr:hypothetical protein [Frankia canadensis]SNQ51764.1 conserved hypothetical protein [Frankia canadensis]SOU59054.1 conserved hypothetical protein [Frankia canadensis]